VFSVFGAISGLGLIVVLFGFGKGLLDKDFTAKRKRPDSVPIMDVSTTPSNLPTEVATLGMVLTNMVSKTGTGNSSANIALTCESFSAPTPSFVMEVSHPEKTIRNAIAFVQYKDVGERPYTVIPVQKDEGRYRIILPEFEAGAQLVILLNIDIGLHESVESVASRFVFRSLQ